MSSAAADAKPSPPLQTSKTQSCEALGRLACSRGAQACRLKQLLRVLVLAMVVAPLVVAVLAMVLAAGLAVVLAALSALAGGPSLVSIVFQKSIHIGAIYSRVLASFVLGWNVSSLKVA